MVGTSGQWPSGSMKKPCSGQQVSLAVHAAAAGVCVCVSTPVSKDTTLVLVLTYPTTFSTTVQ